MSLIYFGHVGLETARVGMMDELLILKKFSQYGQCQTVASASQAKTRSVLVLGPFFTESGNGKVNSWRLKTNQLSLGGTRCWNRIMMN